MHVMEGIGTSFSGDGQGMGSSFSGGGVGHGMGSSFSGDGVARCTYMELIRWWWSIGYAEFIQWWWIIGMRSLVSGGRVGIWEVHSVMMEKCGEFILDVHAGDQ